MRGNRVEGSFELAVGRLLANYLRKFIPVVRELAEQDRTMLCKGSGIIFGEYSVECISF